MFLAGCAAGLLLFDEAAVDCVVLEVGLGGRLDSTNVVTPAVACITSIELERMCNAAGPTNGDVVLREVARAMKDCLRSSDDICRFGGEEFLAICPDADIEVAHTLGDRLREAVAAAMWEPAYPVVEVS